MTRLAAPRIPPLRALRERRGLSLRDCARRADIDPAHLSRAERGEARLSLDSLLRVARVLGEDDLAQMLRLFAGNGDG
jgi:transcriptional regulator with XRE-family HTH domain